MGTNLNWSADTEKDFRTWMADDNVIKNSDGTYSTQDAQWKNRLKDLNALRLYYKKEFLGETKDIGMGRMNISAMGDTEDDNVRESLFKKAIKNILSERTQISEMPRKVTEKVVAAFLNRQSKRQGNTHTDGERLYLHNNVIAEWRDDELWITNAGWFSVTTKERLNALPNVNLYQKNRTWYLNGEPWDGNWIKIEGNDERPHRMESRGRKKKPLKEGTGNFYNKNASHIFVVQAEDEWEWDDTTDNIQNALSEIEDFSEAGPDEWDDERNYAGRILGSILRDVDGVYSADQDSKYYEEDEEYEYEVEMICIMRSGYYEAANLDWDMTVYENGSDIGNHDDFEPSAGSDAKYAIQAVIDNLIEEVEAVYAKVSERYKTTARFSSGETWYGKVDDSNEFSKISKILTQNLKRLEAVNHNQRYINEDDRAGEIIMIKIDNYPWYLRRIDSTHLFMVNSLEAARNKNGIPDHIAQHRGRPYYKDISGWLGGSISSEELNGKEYGSSGAEQGYYV